jgi:hypothetical protein
MTFSNPGGAAAAAAAPTYVRALLELLGSRAPFDVLAEQIGWLDRTVAALPDRVLRAPEAPGKWSALEVVQHLADSEIVYAYRTRIILEQDDPPVPGFDQDVWARVLRYSDADLDVALGVIRGVRTANLRLWRSLGPAELARTGRHSERGPESLWRILELSAAHDLVHRRQIERILAGTGAPR